MNYQNNWKIAKDAIIKSMYYYLSVKTSIVLLNLFKKLK